MYTGRLHFQRACIACMFFVLTIPVSWIHAAEQITPVQAKAMIVRFWSSPEGGKLAEKVGLWAAHINSHNKPFFDPREGRIRWGDWRVDPIKQTMLAPSNVRDRLQVSLPADDYRLEGSFVKEGEDYVVKDARVAKVTTIKPEEMKPMLLDFLSSPQSAKLPSWVADSRKLVKSSEVTTISTEGSYSFKIGPWLVDPMFEAVLLVIDSTELNGRIAREDGKYMIKDAVVQEVRMIKPEEAKEMILRYLDNENSHGIKNLLKRQGSDIMKEQEYVKSHNLSLSKARPTTMYADPSVRYEMGTRQYFGPSWSVNPVTHDYRYSIGLTYLIGVFAWENDKYTMYELYPMWVVAK
jgi:hypothetical protein